MAVAHVFGIHPKSSEVGFIAHTLGVEAREGVTALMAQIHPRHVIGAIFTTKSIKGGAAAIAHLVAASLAKYTELLIDVVFATHKQASIGNGIACARWRIGAAATGCGA